MLVGGTVLVLVPLAAFAWILPGPFLWLLGGKYAGLGSECGWVVATGCVTQIGGVMWNLNGSKAWIRVHAPGFIPSILIAQAFAAVTLDLRQFHDVLVFNFATVAAPLLVYMIDAYLGMKVASRMQAAAA
jgi:hypothetical protein